MRTARLFLYLMMLLPTTDCLEQDSTNYRPYLNQRVLSSISSGLLQKLPMSHQQETNSVRRHRRMQSLDRKRKIFGKRRKTVKSTRPNTILKSQRIRPLRKPYRAVDEQRFPPPERLGVSEPRKSSNYPRISERLRPLLKPTYETNNQKPLDLSLHITDDVERAEHYSSSQRFSSKAVQEIYHQQSGMGPPIISSTLPAEHIFATKDSDSYSQLPSPYFYLYNAPTTMADGPLKNEDIQYPLTLISSIASLGKSADHRKQNISPLLPSSIAMRTQVSSDFKQPTSAPHIVTTALQLVAPPTRHEEIHEPPTVYTTTTSQEISVPTHLSSSARQDENERELTISPTPAFNIETATLETPKMQKFESSPNAEKRRSSNETPESPTLLTETEELGEYRNVSMFPALSSSTTAKNMDPTVATTSITSPALSSSTPVERKFEPYRQHKTDFTESKLYSASIKKSATYKEYRANTSILTTQANSRPTFGKASTHRKKAGRRKNGSFMKLSKQKETTNLPPSNSSYRSEPTAVYPLELHIFFNRYVSIGASRIIFLTMPKLGRQQFILNVTVSTEDYLINEKVTTPTKKSNGWRWIRDLNSLLIRYNIREQSLPYNSCYYYYTNATFWDRRPRIVIAMITAYDQRNRLLAPLATRGIIVRHNRLLACEPLLRLPHCQDPTRPVPLAHRGYNAFNAELEGCPFVPYAPLNWHFYDIGESHHIGHAGTTSGLTLKLLPYKIKFENKPWLFKLFILRVHTIIQGTMAVARCYVTYYPPVVEPKIIGSQLRESNFFAPIKLNGTASRDWAKEYWSSQKNLLWSCSCKQDPDNHYCRTNMSKAHVLNIPAQKLKLGLYYNFTLVMFSSIDSRVHRSTTQTLKIVDYGVFTPQIVCMRNCKVNFFAPDESVHVTARCFQCTSPIKKVEWWLSVQDVEPELLSREIHFIFDYLAQEVKIELIMTLADGRTAATSKTFHINTGPQDGDCTVTPTSGREAKTLFTIDCHNFSTQFRPIEYRYMVPRGVVETNVHYERMTVMLPATKLLIITACDAMDACTELSVVVKVRPLQISGMKEIKAFLTSGQTYVANHLQHGRWQHALICTLAAAKHAASSHEVKLVYDEIADYDIATASQLEQLVMLASHVVSQLSPLDFHDAGVMASIFVKISVLFEVVISEQEWMHRDSYNSLTAMHIFFLLILSTESEPHARAMCKAQDEECSMGQELTGSSDLFLHFDPLACQRLNKWLKCSWFLYKNIYYLGFLATRRHHPYDEAMSVYKAGLAYQINVTDTAAYLNLTLETIDDVFNVLISKELMIELSEKLENDIILFQIISQRNRHNIYWWYPEALPSLTNLLIFHAYSPAKAYPSGAYFIVSNPLVFQMNITQYGENREFAEWMVNSSLPSYSHIHYYKLHLIKRAMLAVRVMSCTAPIRVAMRLHRKPRVDEIERYGCVIPAYTYGKRIWIANFCNEPTIAYVAIRSAEKFASNFDLRTHRRRRSVKRESDNEKNEGEGQDEAQYEEQGGDEDEAKDEYNDEDHDEDDEEDHDEDHEEDHGEDYDNVEGEEQYDTEGETDGDADGEHTDEYEDVTPGSTAQNNTESEYGTTDDYEYEYDYEQENTTEAPNNNGSDTTPPPPFLGPTVSVRYSILLETFHCSFWKNRSLSPGWSADHCTTNFNYTKGHAVQCTCYILGPLATRIFPTKAKPIVEIIVIPVLSINWLMIGIYAVLLLLLFLILTTYMTGIAAHQKDSLLECDKIIKQDITMSGGTDIIILITTGGPEFAGTTSNVTLYFKTRGQPQITFHINQDPARPKLVRNSSCKLFLGVSIKLPTRLAIGIDRNGRYPSWYCRSVTICDRVKDTEQTFIVERWFYEGTSKFMSSAHLSQEDERFLAYNWCERFRRKLEELFINWFMFQPILGPWMSSENEAAMNRFERSCVWICKVAITLCIASLYFGPTTAQTIREEGSSDNLDIKVIMGLSLWCYLACLVVDLFFYVIIMRCLLRR